MDRQASSPSRAYLFPTGDGGLYWGDLTTGTLIQRYKRFLADVRLADGSVVTAHTANTGAMLGCSEPGRQVWLSHHDTPGRKLKYTLEMIDMPDSLVGVNTGVPNRLVKAAALAGKIAGLPFPAEVKSEVKCGASRLDLLVRAKNQPDTYVEIKNCTLVEQSIARFPDAVSARGARHLEELALLAKQGMGAVIFVLVQRHDAGRFSPADAIDPLWGQTLRRVVNEGVRLLVYSVCMTTESIRLDQMLPVML